MRSLLLYRTAPWLQLHPQTRVCASRSGSVLVHQVFSRFSIYSLTKPFIPHSVARWAPGKFPSGFLVRKVKGTVPNPSCTWPRERFRMRVLAAYVYTAVEFQSDREYPRDIEERKRARGRKGREGWGMRGRTLLHRLVSSCVSMRIRCGGCDGDSDPVGVRTWCRRRNTSPYRHYLMIYDYAACPPFISYYVLPLPYTDTQPPHSST